MVKVSMIIPAYNSAKCIIQCLDNAVRQTLQKIEIIVVNDGSTDNTSTVIREYISNCDKGNTIKFIDSEKNTGAGGARNQGLSIAQGDYISFVDADDIIDEEMIEKLYRKACETGADVVECALYDSKKQKAEIAIDEECTGIIDSKKRNNLILAGGYVYTKIYNRQFLEENKIRFRENVKLEDADFLMKIQLYVNNVAIVREVLYIYNNVSNEAGWSVNNATMKEYPNILALMKAIIDDVMPLPEAEIYRHLYEASLLRLYAMGIRCCTDTEQVGKQELKALKNLRTMKNRGIRGGYNNPLVVSNISEQNIELMKYVDNV